MPDSHISAAPLSQSYVVIGAGFSGVAVAVQLLKNLHSPSTVFLINRNSRFGRGLAYGTNSESHVLNVPAGRMGIDPLYQDGFTDYLELHKYPFKAHEFVPRNLYGDYLEHCLREAANQAAKGVELHMLTGEVQSIRKTPGAGVLEVHLASGQVIRAHETVLALGNFAPRHPFIPRQETWLSPLMVNDVWAPTATKAIPPTANVLLIGSGLTAYDAALRLLDSGHTGPIAMLSRRGLLPQPHRQNEVPPAPNLVPVDFLKGQICLRGCLKAVRQLMQQAAQSGCDWRDIVGGLRQHTPRIWQQLNHQQRAQFLRHLLPYWEIHRHRCAPQTFERMRQAIHRGQLSMIAGRLLDAIPLENNTVLTHIRPRGNQASVSQRYGAIVNCTGPSSDLTSVSDVLMCQLQESGLVVADALHLGLLVDSNYCVLDRASNPVPHLRYVGPLLRAQLWEATAVPELRVHAKEVVKHILKGGSTPPLEGKARSD